jgi:hypothetical protein
MKTSIGNKREVVKALAGFCIGVAVASGNITITVWVGTLGLILLWFF